MLYVRDFTKHEVRKHVNFQEDAAPLAFGKYSYFSDLGLKPTKFSSQVFRGV